MGKSVVESAKKAVKKATATKPQLTALRDGSHSVKGTVYTFKKGDTVTLSSKDHIDAMMASGAFEG